MDAPAHDTASDAARKGCATATNEVPPNTAGKTLLVTTHIVRRPSTRMRSLPLVAAIEGE